MYKEGQSQWGSREYAHIDLTSGERYFFEKYLKGKSGRVLEAGTGSGRLSFHAEKIGEFEIDAFDFQPEFIENAKRFKEDMNSKVRFSCTDASTLDEFQDDTYDYGIYMAQVLSFVPADRVDQAISECYRKMKTGGIVLITLLNYEGRWHNRLQTFILTILRRLRGESGLSGQDLPWLHINRRPNWNFFEKGQATNHWYYKNEAAQKFEEKGFHVLECATGEEIGFGGKGPLYLAVQK